MIALLSIFVLLLVLAEGQSTRPQALPGCIMSTHSHLTDGIYMTWSRKINGYLIMKYVDLNGKGSRCVWYEPAKDTWWITDECSVLLGDRVFHIKGSAYDTRKGCFIEGSEVTDSNNNSVARVYIIKAPLYETCIPTTGEVTDYVKKVSFGQSANFDECSQMVAKDQNTRGSTFSSLTNDCTAYYGSGTRITTEYLAKNSFNWSCVFKTRWMPGVPNNSVYLSDTQPLGIQPTQERCLEAALQKHPDYDFVGNRVQGGNTGECLVGKLIERRIIDIFYYTDSWVFTMIPANKDALTTTTTTTRPWLTLPTKATTTRWSSWTLFDEEEVPNSTSTTSICAFVVICIGMVLSYDLQN